MVKVWRVTLLSLLFTVILSSAAAAQEPVPSQPRPLLMSAVHDRRFIIGHDLYRFAGGEWEAVTSDGFKGGFRLSPTGFIMAVQAVPVAIRAAKASLNGIDPVDVNRSYRYEQGFTFELNLAGVGDEARAAFVEKDS